MSEPPSKSLLIGDWRADFDAGRLVRADQARLVEPKVMDLLFLLASQPGQVFGRERIFDAVWPGVTVGEDTLTRCVSKLRTALDDDARSPAYVETISKRGYRLIAEVRPAPGSAPPGPRPAPGLLRGRGRAQALLGLALIAALLAVAVLYLKPLPAIQGEDGESARLTRQAHDFYFQYSRADNEAARTLYERAIAADADNPAALAGLSNTLVQTVLRWPGAPGDVDYSRTDLGLALADGRTRTPEARRRLDRARALAERAVRLSPRDAFMHQSLGLVAAAQADFDVAQQAYDQAIALDPDAWGALINRGDLMEIRGDRVGSIPWFERAHDAMGRVYDAQASRVRPWRAEVGVLIARRYEEAARLDAAETWYRRVLGYAPLHPSATGGLAGLLERQGDRDGAQDLCRRLVENVGPDPACDRLLARARS